MQTRRITTTDGTSLVFDIAGSGPALILLHGGGGGQSRKSWHETGYVDRLKELFTVIVIDLRGHGESDKPLNKSAYTIQRMCQDIIEIADACHLDRFIVWGFSYGGNLGRFLARDSSRVRKLVMIGIPFGPAADGEFRDFIHEFTDFWQPIIEAQRNNTLDLSQLTEERQEELKHHDIEHLLAWLGAMLDWGSVEPADLKCPTLWISGSKNRPTYDHIMAVRENLIQTLVFTETIEGLDHMQEFSQIDIMLPIMQKFTIA